MNNIIFHSTKHYNNKNGDFAPSPSAKVLPKWWHDAEVYVKDPFGNPVANWNGEGRMPSFKACPAILDTFTTGYMLVTPCDLEFYEKHGRVKVRLPIGFDDFCGERPAMEGFSVPPGYDKNHFHWYANWAPELPEGYSSLYVPPINHFDLPWITVGGIIDSDKVKNSGLIPFFLKSGFTGVVKAGTPYLQIIPFKREDWNSELIYHDAREIARMTMETAETFRTPEGGVYKKKFWSRRKYR